MIYLDNAATSWPKPESVYQMVDKVMRQIGANPGRSGHTMAIEAGRLVQETRELAAALFAIPHPSQVVFTLNVTDSLNLALKGLLQPGDHVITSSMEHNAMARPLEALRKNGVTVTKVATSPVNGISLREIQNAIQANTKLIAITHASNVTGTLNPIGEIGQIAKEFGVTFLVDCAQTAGVFPINVQEMGIDLLAFPGHKSLLGCQGVGGLYVHKGIILKTLREGGTGSHSESLEQPDELPERYESGTLNTSGIAGLGAGIRYIMETGMEKIKQREEELTNLLVAGLAKIPGVVLYGPPLGQQRAAVVSFNLEQISANELCMILDKSFQIAVRPGLHCAPDAHRVLGTLQGGTIRISPGYFTTEEEIETCLQAITAIGKELVEEMK
ncbi:aminotransferase class V-fold PLP-dependent enzyme [Pelosinus baikalensis]|uniref:cysteine desulfurase n=1 Tax=Pelosinus baikalensis TaxID=2892015 RepID=A0ABS8HTD1_9FIRM|nr:aminotransferase class V-fold PLP-dependent enzyme [Pelosinus baikalensis]MCC5466428.1 aminotransferase class V-fold PLP-dependent enzyme [Pelosinus baikalensis]